MFLLYSFLFIFPILGHELMIFNSCMNLSKFKKKRWYLLSLTNFVKRKLFNNKGFRDIFHSHSIVAGGFEVMS